MQPRKGIQLEPIDKQDPPSIIVTPMVIPPMDEHAAAVSDDDGDWEIIDDNLLRQRAQTQLQRAKNLLHGAFYSQAVDGLNLAVQTLHRAKVKTDHDYRNLAHYHFLLAESYFEMYKEEPKFAHVWPITIVTGNPADQAKRHYELAITYQSKVESPATTRNREIEFFDEDLHIMANYHYAWGFFLLYLKDWSHAREHLEMSIACLDYIEVPSLEDIEKRVKFNQVLGLACQELKDWPHALDCFNLAFKLLDPAKITDSHYRAAASAYQGAAAAKSRSDHTIAFELYMSALSLLRQLPNKLADDITSLRNVYKQLSQIPYRGPDYDLFHFASLAFSTFVTETDFSRLMFNLTQSEMWHQKQVVLHAIDFLELLTATCRLESFPNSDLKTWLKEEVNFKQLEQQIERLRGIVWQEMLQEKKPSVEARLAQLEQENALLRTKLEQLQSRLSVDTPLSPISREDRQLQQLAEAKVIKTPTPRSGATTPRSALFASSDAIGFTLFFNRSPNRSPLRLARLKKEPHPEEATSLKPPSPSQGN